MCKLFGGGDAPEVDTTFQDFQMRESRRARREADRRERRIGRGMEEIAAIFEGGRGPGGRKRATEYDPNQKYYTRDGKLWTPQTPRAATPDSVINLPGQLGQTRKDGAKLTTVPFKAPDAQGNMRSTIRYVWVKDGKIVEGGDVVGMPGDQREVKGDPGVPSAEDQFGKLDLFTRTRGKRYAGMDPLLAAREEAMRGYYLPQLREQFGDAKDELTFALTRAGLGVSTAANEKRADLREGFRRERAGVLSDIEKDMSRTRSAMEDSRTNIEAMLRSSGDATAATDAALRSRSVFAEDQPELNPLTNMLTGFSQNIGQLREGYQVGQIRRAAGGSPTRDLSRIVS